MIIKRHFAPRRAGWRGGDLNLQLRMGYGRASRVLRGDDLGTAGFGRLRGVSSHDVRSRSLSNLGRVVRCWIARLGRGRAGAFLVCVQKHHDTFLRLPLFARIIL
jgi:hypothetical protein